MSRGNVDLEENQLLAIKQLNEFIEKSEKTANDLAINLPSDEDFLKQFDPPQKEKGKRFDQGKPRTDLLSPIALMGIAKVLAYGVDEYGARNWQKGMEWGKVIGPLLRHTLKFMAGEDSDSKTGLPHVDHIAANAMFLQEYFRTHKDLDDREKTGWE